MLLHLIFVMPIIVYCYEQSWSNAFFKRLNWTPCISHSSSKLVEVVAVSLNAYKRYGSDAIYQKKPKKHYTATPFDYKSSINYSHFKAKTRDGPSESISFRLSHNILHKLRQEAKQKEISLDTLMTQIAKQHAEWHANASQIGFISVRKTLIMKLLDEIRDNER